LIAEKFSRDGFIPKIQKAQAQIEYDANLDFEKVQKLIAYLSKRLSKDVKLDDHLEFDLGLDSLGRAELLLELQKLFQIEIPESVEMEIFYARTVRELLTKIQSLLSEQKI